MAITHVQQVATGGLVVEIGSPATVTGFTGIQAGDLFAICVTWGYHASSIHDIPDPVTYSLSGAVEIAREEVGGGGAKTTLVYAFASGGETSFTISGEPENPVTGINVVVDVFRGFGGSATMRNSAVQLNTGLVATIPTVTPEAGEETALWVPFSLNPDYNPTTLTGGYTVGTRWATGGGLRLAINSAYQIVASPSGSYTGTISSGGESGTGWTVAQVAFDGGEPPAEPEPGGVLDPPGEIDAAPLPITGDIMSWVIRRGSGAEITGTAEPGSATVRLRNTDNKYNPENAGSPIIAYLRDGTAIWLGINNDGLLAGDDLRGLFAGRITDITVLPMAGPDDAPVVELQCEDALGWFGRSTVNVPFIAGRTQRALRQLILTQVGESRSSLDHEIHALPLSGADGNALTALEALNRANGTRHFIKPADDPGDWYAYTTYNRQHGLDGVADATLAGTDISAGAGVSWRLAVDTVTNAQRATVTPIRFTPNTFTVWTADVLPIIVNPTTSYVVWVEFDDYVSAPTLNVTRTGTAPTTETIETFGTRAKITLAQAGVGASTTYTRLAVEGSLARRLPDESWFAEDATSQLPPRGIRQGPDIRGDYVGTLETARGIAEHVVWRYATPQTRPTLTVINWFPEMFDVDLGDILSVTFAEVGATAQLFELVGLTHKGYFVTPTRSMHTLELVLQKCRVQSDPGWFTWDVSDWDGTDVLGY